MHIEITAQCQDTTTDMGEIKKKKNVGKDVEQHYR